MGIKYIARAVKNRWHLFGAQNIFYKLSLFIGAHQDGDVTGLNRRWTGNQTTYFITNGIRKMPAYGSQIAVEDRWAIVLYLQALQRSQTASSAEVPEEIREKLN